ncbi:hypothetical protein [Actinokineospora inagensis]|uniref:hypothetical protein n=1 Tax=Actinokineospora inagensis TaxID=103730 RepID=UPI0012FC1E12|nr:hypothetical protein [Actinokineospora inagensis]
MSLDVLNCLMGLPVGLPVATADLTERERVAVREAPAHAVEVHQGGVVRHAVAPVAVELALIAARDWRVGLRSAGAFAPFCARAVLLTTLPSDEDELREQALRFGVGVFTSIASEQAVFSEPRPYARRRHTAAQWKFAEDVYSALKEQGSA